MTWRDDLRPASFRGVHFFVESAELVGGRRTVTHEYPLRNKPHVEDLGRRARRYPVDGYILSDRGESYFGARNALIDALEDDGPGALVHPYFGDRQVICSSFRVREEKANGGLVLFAMEFEETDQKPLFPKVGADTAARVNTRATAAIGASRSVFGRIYSVSGQPQSFVDRLASIIKSASTEMQRLLAPVTSGTRTLSALKKKTDRMFVDASSLARDPFETFGRFNDVLSSFRVLPLTPSLNLKRMLRVYGFTSGNSILTTAARQREALNREAILAQFRQQAVIEAARMSPLIAFTSHDEAVDIRAQIAAMLDEQADTADDDLYKALVELRAEVVEAVPGPAAELPSILTYTLAEGTPALVVSHTLYGDVSGEADIIARNNVRHPGIVPGGAALKVLSDA